VHPPASAPQEPGSAGAGPRPAEAGRDGESRARAPRVLIVRLGALGDLVHALPALGALRHAWPDAAVDWLVDGRYVGLLQYVRGLGRVVVVGKHAGAPWVDRDAPPRLDCPGLAGLRDAVRAMRARRYDAAVDLQGLMKSAALARLSGAARVIGFSAPFLRERPAGLFYTETAPPAEGPHVVHKNLAALRGLGIDAASGDCLLAAPLAEAVAHALPPPDASGRRPFAVVNPGAGWPNKRWPAERFGAVAAHLRHRHGLLPLVTWGPGEREVADAVVQASGGAAQVAPQTTLGDVMAMLSLARVFVGGDTGPLQLAAAFGTPTVMVFGPTNPARNGSWREGDLALSRFDACECHHKRQCRRATPCINEIGVGEVIAAVDLRLSRPGPPSPV